MSEIESGKKEPTLALLGRYSEELNIPLSSLLFFAENVEGPKAPETNVVAAKVLKLLEFIGASRDNSPRPKRKPHKGRRLRAPPYPDVACELDFNGTELEQSGTANGAKSGFRSPMCRQR